MPHPEHLYLQLVVMDTPFRGRLSTFIAFTLGESAGQALCWRAPSHRRATRPPKQRGEREAGAIATARRARTRRRRIGIARVARRKEISPSRLPMHGRNCFIFWRIFLSSEKRGAFTLQGLLLNVGRARSLQVRIATSVLIGRCEGGFSLAPAAPTRLEPELQTDLNVPGRS